MEDYVHGYSARESRRLQDQASALVELLHHDSLFPAGSKVLEAGCGVGSQTVTLARRNPGTSFTSVDISEASLEVAAGRVADAGLANVALLQADILELPFAPASFDHVFVCFVLEHLEDPLGAVRRLSLQLRPGGTITVIEGDHGSAYFYPDSRYAVAAIRSLVEVQAAAGGNALIGRQLFPLLTEAGFRGIDVSPRMVYADASRPDLVEGFVRNTFTAMVEGVREQAIGRGAIEAATFDQGIRDLYRTAEPDGTFCYTFFKARATHA